MDNTTIMMLICTGAVLFVGLWMFVALVHKINKLEDAINHTITVGSMNNSALDTVKDMLSHLGKHADCTEDDLRYIREFFEEYLEDDCECECCECCCQDEDECEEDLDIHMITKEEFYFNRDYSKYVLDYDEEGGTLSYSSVEKIDNVQSVIGDALLFFGVDYKNPSKVFVRNHILKCDFVVRKVAKKDVKHAFGDESDDN